MRDGVLLPPGSDDLFASEPLFAQRSDRGRSEAGRRLTLQSPNEALQPEAAPPPPPKPPSRRRPTLSTLSGFLSFLVIVAVGALFAVTWSRAHLNEAGPLTTDKIVFIEPHTDLSEIIAKLESEGVIDSKWLFQTALSVEGKRGKVKSGEYLFKQHASMRAVIDTMVSGKQVLHGVTIPEGLTSAQIAERLRESDVLIGDIREIPKEGTLLPETYKVARGASRGDLMIKMQEDDRRAVEQIWLRRSPDLPLRSPYELVILASIVEKETGKADERSRVAGVFINRLQKHMRLQSDPTIVYGLVGGQGTLGHSITRSELDKKTPYNTYQIDGLPPGPIDNPGRAALEAVANPSRTQDLYFVADGTGGHAFAASIEEHNRNVQRWRQIEREAKDKSDVDKVSPSTIAPTTRGNQRSDATDDKAYGNLPRAVSMTSAGSKSSFMDLQVNHGMNEAFAFDARSKAGWSLDGAPPQALAALSDGLDTLAFSVQGAKPTASDLLDGPVADDQAAAAPPAATVAPKAGSKIASAAPTAKLDALPSDHPVDLFADRDDGAASSAPTKLPPAHPKIYDVSEGTSLDPLKNHSYDLNSAKVIPTDLQK